MLGAKQGADGATVTTRGRDYAAGVRPALAVLSQGTCYFPDCTTPIVVFLDGDPHVNFEIAHIRDANPGNRYEPRMSDDERRSFRNLVLLCKPHHTLVDKSHPERYRVEDLEEWKAAREGPGVEALTGLRGVTEAKLAELITAATHTALQTYDRAGQQELADLVHKLSLDHAVGEEDPSDFLGLALRVPQGADFAAVLRAYAAPALPHLRPAFEAARWVVPATATAGVQRRRGVPPSPHDRRVRWHLAASRDC